MTVRCYNLLHDNESFLWRRRLRHRHYPIVRVVDVVGVTKLFCVHSAETVRDMPMITTGRKYHLTSAIIFAVII